MAPQIVHHRGQPGQHRGLWEFQVVAMFGQEIDPLSRAFDPERRPDLLGMDLSLALLPIRALEFVRVRHRCAFDRLHLDPSDWSFSDGSGQTFGFFLVHRCPLSQRRRERKNDAAGQTTTRFTVEATELIIAHRHLSEQSLLEGATTARWRMSRSLAVVEQSAFSAWYCP